MCWCNGRNTGRPPESVAGAAANLAYILATGTEKNGSVTRARKLSPEGLRRLLKALGAPNSMDGTQETVTKWCKMHSVFTLSDYSPAGANHCAVRVNAESATYSRADGCAKRCRSPSSCGMCAPRVPSLAASGVIRPPAVHLCKPRLHLYTATRRVVQQGAVISSIAAHPVAPTPLGMTSRARSAVSLHVSHGYAPEPSLRSKNCRAHDLCCFILFEVQTFSLRFSMRASIQA